MNKLASILYLRKIGLPTIFPRVIISHETEKVLEIVNSFYYDYSNGWVLRCARLPNMDDRTEGLLPWDIAHSKQELITKIFKLQKKIDNKYYVFCHEAKHMIRGGMMLIEGNRVIIEAGFGDRYELSAMFRGKSDPEQRVTFKPGMFSFKKSGKKVLTTDDLYELRIVERRFNWNYLSALTNPAIIEFSRLKKGGFYVHDIKILE